MPAGIRRLLQREVPRAGGTIEGLARAGVDDPLYRERRRLSRRTRHLLKAFLDEQNSHHLPENIIPAMSA